MATAARMRHATILCLAGGSGLSPMISITRAAAASEALKDRNIHFVYGGRTPRDICGEQMLKELRGFGERIHYTPIISMTDDPSSSGWSGKTDLSTTSPNRCSRENRADGSLFRGAASDGAGGDENADQGETASIADALRPVLLSTHHRGKSRSDLSDRLLLNGPTIPDRIGVRDDKIRGGNMSKLNLTLACWNYDRTRAIQDGSVQPDGIEINYLDLPVEETFFRMVRFREFDVAEMSLSSYTVSLHRDPKPFVAIPVFPSRFFRHSCIFVSAKSNIREPKDLIGKKIGVPEFQMTAPVWIRAYSMNSTACPLTA